MKQEHLEWKDFFKRLEYMLTKGQKYEPEDADQLSSYREDKKGQVLEEGITERLDLCHHGLLPVRLIQIMILK